MFDAGDGQSSSDEGDTTDVPSALATDILARIESLTTGHDVDLAENIDRFQEIKQAFAIPNAELHFVRGACPASLEDGGSLELVGFWKTSLDDGTRPALEFKRHLKLGERCADHQWLRVAPYVRGIGLSSAFLLRSFDFYKQLGLREVELDAVMETGKWHWARIGFEFKLPSEAAAVRGWALEVAEALQPGGINVEPLAAATQFARMEARRGVSLAELAAAFPEKAPLVPQIASENSLDVDEPIAFGRAVMLTGPGWKGRLDLNGPGYHQFKSYAEAKAEEAERALSS